MTCKDRKGIIAGTRKVRASFRDRFVAALLVMREQGDDENRVDPPYDMKNPLGSNSLSNVTSSLAIG